MGINKFSVYSSFENKNGIFIESLKYNRQKINKLINTLKSAENGVLGIKQFFYDFIDFTNETEFKKGCLVSNTFGLCSASRVFSRTQLNNYIEYIFKST
jgi:TetR/AcrR family transcriptional repressor of nem operon